MPAVVVFGFVFLLLWLRPGARPAVGEAPTPRTTTSLWVWGLVLLLFAGNRFNGADWINYKKAFEAAAVADGPLSAVVDSPFEWLFSLLLWLLGGLGLPYEAVVVVVGLFNVVVLRWVVIRMGVRDPGRLLALLILIEGWTLYHEQLRQSVAVTLCLAATVRVVDRRWPAALVLWVAATGFHSSAVITPLVWLVASHCRRHANRPVPLLQVLVVGLVAFAVVGGGLALVREGVLPLPGLDRLRNKLQLYEEHDVFGGALFTAGMAAYAIAFALLMSVRGSVMQRRQFWLSFAWSAALLWAVLGPLLRTQAILIRFEHYLLIYLPLCLALLLETAPVVRPRARHALLATMICLFAATFPARVFLHPENLVWSLDYQNMLLTPLTEAGLEDEDLRESLICANLALFDNDFCGRDPAL